MKRSVACALEPIGLPAGTSLRAMEAASTASATFDDAFVSSSGASPTACRAGPGTICPVTGWVRCSAAVMSSTTRSEEHTSELQSRGHLVCRLLLEKKKKNKTNTRTTTAREYAPPRVQTH